MVIVFNIDLSSRLKLHGTNVILRYLGRKAGLYGCDDLEAAQVFFIIFLFYNLHKLICSILLACLTL